MDMLEILRNRRSIRRYKDRGIEGEKIDLLKEAVLRSPSSRGINPWRFVFVTDKEFEKKRPVPSRDLEYDKILTKNA